MYAIYGEASDPQHILGQTCAIWLLTDTCCCICMQVSVLYTAPTAIRSLMAKGDGPVTKHKRSSLRILGTVGEPINPEAWRWYYEVSLSCQLNSAVMKITDARSGVYLQQHSSCTVFSRAPPPPFPRRPCFILLPLRNSIPSVSCVMCVSHAGSRRQQVPNC